MAADGGCHLQSGRFPTEGAPMANSEQINNIKAVIASNTDDVDMRNTLVKDLLDQGHISGLHVSEVDISSVPTVKKQPPDIAEFLAERVTDPDYLAARAKSESRKGVLKALKYNSATPLLSVALIEMKEARRDKDEPDFYLTVQHIDSQYTDEEMTVDEIVEFLNGSVKTLGAVNMGVLARELQHDLRCALRDAGFGRPDVPTDDPVAATWSAGSGWLFSEDDVTVEPDEPDEPVILSPEETFTSMIRGDIAANMTTFDPDSIELADVLDLLVSTGDGRLDVDDVERLLAYADRLNFHSSDFERELVLSDAAEEYLYEEVLRLADATPDSVPAPATVTALGMALGVTGDSERQIRIRTGAAINAAARLRDSQSGGALGEATIRFHLMGRAVLNDAEHLTDGEAGMLIRAVVTHRGTRYSADAGYDIDAFENYFTVGGDVLSRVDVETVAAYLCIAGATSQNRTRLSAIVTVPVFDQMLEMFESDVLGVQWIDIYNGWRCSIGGLCGEFAGKAFVADASSDDRYIAERLLVLTKQNMDMLNNPRHVMVVHERLGGSLDAWEVFLSAFTEESTLSEQINTARLLVGLDMEGAGEPDQTVNDE